MKKIYHVIIWDEINIKHRPLKRNEYLKSSYYPLVTIDKNSNIELRKDGYHKYPHHKMLCTYLYPYYAIQGIKVNIPKIEKFKITWFKFEYIEGLKLIPQITKFSIKRELFKSSYDVAIEDGIELNPKIEKFSIKQVLFKSLYDTVPEDGLTIKPQIELFKVTRELYKVLYEHPIEDALYISSKIEKFVVTKEI